jgi:hypothetical protein
MKILPYILAILSINLAMGQEKHYDKVFFDNSPMQGNYFYSSVSYTSPGWVKNIRKKLPVEEQKFFTPGNSLELTYRSAENGHWQAKILYHPIRGMDHFSQAEKLSFRLYVQSNTRADELPAVALGNRKEGLASPVAMQDYVQHYQTGKWLRVNIPIERFRAAKPLRVENINTIAFQQRSNDGGEHQLYIDQVELLPQRSTSPLSQPPSILAAMGYEKHVDIQWEKITDERVKYVKIYRSTDNENFQPVAIQEPWISRYSDYTDTCSQEYHYKISLLDSEYRESPLSGAVSAQTRPMNDQELLDMIQKANFRYYWEGAEPNSGMALECIPGRRHMVATGASGFGIMSLLVGAERDFITRDQLVQRLDKITRFLESADRFHGAFPHFIDGKTGRVVSFFGPKDNGGDLVETAFLTQGLLAARGYLDNDTERERKIRERITKIWEGIEWDWYRQQEDSDYLTWHWSPDQGWVIDHQLIGWNETMITYILAIASPTHSIPASMYYTGWAGPGEKAREYRKNWGKTEEGEHYTNGNVYYGIPLDVGVSSGGPLFFTHYSYMGLNPHQVEDAYTNYFENNRKIARINYRYCLENPEDHQGYGPGCWGLTASDGPWGYSADEPKPAGDRGKMTPTGALASFPYTPKQSMQALKNYYHKYGRFLWGAYGFRDAFNLDENWRSDLYMGLNQAPVAVMIENHRSGLIWDLFMENQEIKKALNAIQK